MLLSNVEFFAVGRVPEDSPEWDKPSFLKMPIFEVFFSDEKDMQDFLPTSVSILYSFVIESKDLLSSFLVN